MGLKMIKEYKWHKRIHGLTRMSKELSKYEEIICSSNLRTLAMAKSMYSRVYYDKSISTKDSNTKTSNYQATLERKYKTLS